MSLADVKLHLVDDLDTAQEMMRWLGERREIDELAVDSETTGLSQEHDHLRLAQIGDTVHGWAIPWEQWGGVFLEALRKYEGRIICHNLSFDMGMIRGTCGYQLPQDRCDDTRLMAHVLDPGFSTALKPLAGRHIDPMAMALQDQWKSSTGWTWATVPVDYGPYWQYACVPKTTEIFTKRGWLKWSDAIPGEDHTLGYNMETGRSEWTLITRVNDVGWRDVVRLGNKHWSTICTENHRWIMQKGTKQKVQIRELRDGWRDQVTTKMILGAEYVGGTSEITAGEAAVLAWVLSDGNVSWQRPKTWTSPIVSITQSMDKFADEIRELLKREGAYVSERRTKNTRDCLKFNVQATYFTRLWHKANLPNISLIEFVWNLPYESLVAWTDAWLMAEGTQGKAIVSQNLGPKLDALELSLILTGHATDIQSVYPDGKCARLHYNKGRPLTPQKTRITDAGQDDVWCPTTELGTWLARDSDRNTYLTGNSMDTVLTARLAQVLRPRLDATNSVRAYELELAASWVCERMERNGIMVDRPYASEALERFQTHARALSDWCSENYGVRPSQNASVAQRLMQDGVVLDKATASGAVQMDKEVLGGIDHPLAQVVLEHRRYSKLASTYLRNFVSGTSEKDPRLHPRINTVGAVTGRMSMDSPNLQNLPRNSENNPAAITVRNCLVASEGHTLLMTDYSQVELRILAHISQDPGLISAFEDEDVFTSIARELFADPTLTKKDERRGHTKNALYALSYGAGATKFAKTAGLSDEQGELMYALIAQRYPKMKGLGRAVETRAMQRLADEGVAYARSPLTGRRHPMNADKRYGLVNALTQGTAAEVLKMKLCELDAAGYAEYLVLPVHDEVILDVPTDQLDEIARDVSKIMSDAEMFSVPLTTDASVGQRWGEKTEWVPT